MTPDAKKSARRYGVGATGQTDRPRVMISHTTPAQVQPPRLRLIQGGSRSAKKPTRRPPEPPPQPAPRPRRISKLEHWKLLYQPNPPRQLVVEPLGLCATCAKLMQCDIAALPGGIWSCEEFSE